MRSRSFRSKCKTNFIAFNGQNRIFRNLPTDNIAGSSKKKKSAINLNSLQSNKTYPDTLVSNNLRCSAVYYYYLIQLHGEKLLKSSRFIAYFIMI